MLSAWRSGKKPEYVAFSMSSSFLNHQVFYPILAAHSKILHTLFRDCLWACSFHFQFTV